MINRWLTIMLLTVTSSVVAKERIEFMVSSGEQMTFVNEFIKPEYERRYPDVTLILTNDTNLETRMAAGDYPNVYAGVFGYMVPRYAKLGRLMYLNEFDGFNQLEERIEPQFMAKHFNRNYFIPWHATTQMMIYNKDLFREAGLDPDSPPKTWDAFLSAAEKISNLPARKNGANVYGSALWNDALSWGGWYWNMLSPLYYNFNGGKYQLLNRYGTHPVFDKEEASMVAFLETMKKVQQFAPLTMEQNFFSRTIGMWPQYGIAWKTNLQDAAGYPMQIGKDVGIAPIPTLAEGDTHYSNLDGRALMVFKNTRKIEQRSWQLIELLMEEDYHLQANMALQNLPTLGSLQSHPYFQQEDIKPFVEQLNNVVMNESSAAVAEVSSIVLKYYSQSVVMEKMTPEAAVEAAAEEVKKILKR
ncbi:extracellular solute-binding protein [Vibrio methylphosphonaticus]|uniref:extracellular solute-binding protein n=1 Tax=Vibrio methylphosphonaticus TaxID=2946866 RepID=UPI002029D5B4|nr:extracellular solute-binding protein [Vibrio methylphosphonaticus]MCL9774064.1 extracellular solute-binding protein [Vibrio methylphosphonaticus]